ncbi:MAG: UDP-glucose 4-epimerase GalE [Brevinema sp.]
MVQTILVIGGAGYIGSHTIKALSQKGYNVVVLDNLSKGHRESLDKSIPFYQGDLADSSLLSDIFTKHSIDVVMHFAALIEVGTSVVQPELYYENNFIKVKHLLDNMLKAGINRFIFSSTAATFGNPQSDKITESHPQLPINPYGSTKLMVEWYLRDLSAAKPDFNYGILRYFNACGASTCGTIGQSYEPASHLLSIIVQAASGRRPSLSVFGNDYPTPDGTCVRDYIHVSDLADAHVLAMERLIKENISDHYNLGNGKGFSVKEMIDAAKRITGVNFTVNEAERRAGDPAYLVADPTKAKSILGWEPKLGLDDMIRTAWNWENNKRY